MSKKEMAKSIVEKIGGPENVVKYTHCVTRLRFVLKNEDKIDEEGLKTISGVMGAVNRGGQYQVIIGSDVERVYNELPQFLPNVQADEVKENSKNAEKTEDTREKQNWFQKMLSYLTASISPTITVIVAAGMINAVLAICVQFFGLSAESPTYVNLRAFSQIGFSYLPVWIAVSAARYLKTDSYIAAFISVASILVFSNAEEMTLFGLAVPNVNYGGAIVPVLLMVPVLAAVDRFLLEHLHKNLMSVLKPLLCVGVTLPLMLFVFGPIGALVGTLLVNVCTALMNIGPVSMAVLAFMHPITVIFGMHSLFTPILMNELATDGVTYVLCRALAANFAMAGAALGVGMKSKKAATRSVGITASITALLAATEPALYGVLLPRRKPLIAACLAAGVSGIFIGLFKVHAYSMGSFNLFTLAYTIGGDTMTNFYLACAFAALAFILGFVFTWLLGFKEEE